MAESLSTKHEGRILLLPPTKRDATAAIAIFNAVGLTLTICRDIKDVCNKIEEGADVVILPDDAILKDKEHCLGLILKRQPAWSDLPLVVLTPTHQTSAVIRELELVGHMTLLPRPIEILSLVSTVQAALRDRHRQYARRAEFVERERQAQALRENDRHKDEFLAMLAHELRNPLAAVNYAVTILKSTGDEESRNWASDVVGRQVGQLVRLIDDLLDVSRITSGKIRLRKEFVDASKPLDQALESVRPLIEERQHTLIISIDRGELPLYVDATRVGQIVLNLLTNAAKYTNNGGKIELTAERQGKQVVISVRDNGMGISPTRLPDMFKLFSQGDRSLARSEGGLGIGLTIVKKLAEMHSGSIEARSEGQDRGSEFVIRLPLARKPVAVLPKPDRKLGPSGKSSRILVVDDVEETALGMVRLLKLYGNEVIAAHDGPAAIETAREFHPDFVLLDIGLPGMDGYHVATALREDDAYKNTVIIAVSGYGQEEDRKKSHAAGFDHHLVKPVDFESLISLLERPA